MSADSQPIARLRIRRGGGTELPRFDEFEVPYTEGASVLDALIWIRVHRDATLAFRYSCVNANACKECVMQVNGEAVYACTARLKPEVMTLEPLAGKKPIRDLVADTVPPKERLGSLP
jgi:succinate dehydrogenase/fumarate reductase-like Fe-S protein